MIEPSEADLDYFSKVERKKNILKFLENGDWKSVIDFYDKNEKFREPLLVWIRPSLDSLQFIEKCLINNLGIEKVTTYYSIVKDSSADLGVNSKIVQIRPTVKAVSTKISKKKFAFLSIFLYF